MTLSTPTFEFLDADTYHQRVTAARDRDWLVEGLVPAVGVTLVVGAPMSGKTTTCQALSVCLAEGRSFLGRRTTPARVLWIAEDRDSGGFSENLQLARAGIGHAASLRILSPSGWKLEEHLNQLVPLLDAGGIDVVIIDCLRRISPFNENDSGEVNEMFELLGRVAADCRAVLVIHHLGANGRIRGSTDFTANAESVLTVKSASNDELALQARHHRAGPLDLRFRLSFDEHGMRVESLATDSAEGDRLRDSILAVLCEKCVGVAELREEVRQRGIKKSNSKISDLLESLQLAGLVVSKKDGRRKVYEITASGRVVTGAGGDHEADDGESCCTPAAPPPLAPVTLPAPPPKGGEGGGTGVHAGTLRNVPGTVALQRRSMASTLARESEGGLCPEKPADSGWSATEGTEG